MVPFGFVVATFLEPISVVVSAVLVGWSVACRRRALPAPFGLVLGHLAGTALLLAAPGNFVRAATLPASPPLDRLFGVAANFGSLFDPTWIVALAVMVLALGWRPPAGWSETLRAGRGWLFVVLAAATMAVLLVVPRAALAARVSFPVSVFLVAWLAAVFCRRPAAPPRERMLTAALLLLAAVHIGVVARDLLALTRIDRAWASDPQLAAGPAADAVLPLVRVRGRLVYARKHVFFEGLTPDPASFVNHCYAKAMNVRTVVAR
jgi:hypothetical protein